MYDPLGFAAPFVLQAKLILQDLCRRNLGWDEKITADLLKRWEAWLEELPKLEQLTVELNPADDASRGVSADSLDRWLQGPEFLGQSEDAWPKLPSDMNANIDDADPEVKGPVVYAIRHGTV